MALNEKKTGFGFDIEERFNKVTSKTQTGSDTHIDDYTHTHEHTHKDVEEPEQRELKQKRVQLLTYESLIKRMDKYAAKRGVSRVTVFETAMLAYLDKVDPIEPKK